jgi:hypothetical protein
LGDAAAHLARADDEDMLERHAQEATSVHELPLRNPQQLDELLFECIAAPAPA